MEKETTIVCESLDYGNLCRFYSHNFPGLLLGFNFLLQLSSAEIRGELSTILEWLVPVASNTTKAHHGFGWVGEWANTG
jgi:hypothetical protein